MKYTIKDIAEKASLSTNINSWEELAKKLLVRLDDLSAVYEGELVIDDKNPLWSTKAVEKEILNGETISLQQYSTQKENYSKENNTIGDLSLIDLKVIENLSVTAITICLSQRLNSLYLILNFYNTKRSFESIKNCGVLSNYELINLCVKYNAIRDRNTSFEIGTANSNETNVPTTISIINNEYPIESSSDNFNYSVNSKTNIVKWQINNKINGVIDINKQEKIYDPFLENIAIDSILKVQSTNKMNINQLATALNIHDDIKCWNDLAKHKEVNLSIENFQSIYFDDMIIDNENPLYIIADRIPSFKIEDLLPMVEVEAETDINLININDNGEELKIEDDLLDNNSIEKLLDNYLGDDIPELDHKIEANVIVYNSDIKEIIKSHFENIKFIKIEEEYPELKIIYTYNNIDFIILIEVDVMRKLMVLKTIIKYEEKAAIDILKIWSRIHRNASICIDEYQDKDNYIINRTVDIKKYNKEEIISYLDDMIKIAKPICANVEKYL